MVCLLYDVLPQCKNGKHVACPAIVSVGSPGMMGGSITHCTCQCHKTKSFDRESEEMKTLYKMFKMNGLK